MGRQVCIVERGDDLLGLTSAPVVLIDEADGISEAALGEIATDPGRFVVVAALPAFAGRLRASLAPG